MATYQSSQTSAIASASSTTITKPTGLAVGDLLVAHLYFEDGSGSPGSYTIPSGWVSQANVVTTGASFNPVRLQVITKVADSADVAASNFTFTAAAAGRCGGGLSRLTTFGKNSGSSTGVQNDSTSSPITVTGFTPDRANCLFMAFTAILGSAAGSTPALTSVSLATDNPTWTERYDLNANIAGFAGFALATATRSQETATGNISFSVALPSNADIALAVIAFSPTLSGSLNATPEVIGTNDYVVLSPESALLTDINPTTSSQRETTWQLETKPTTTWTNETL